MKRLITLLVILVVAIPAAWFVLTKVLIDADKMAKNLSDGLTQATGRKIEVDEGASVKLFPLPQVVYNNFRIYNLPNASSQYLLKSAELVMKVDLASLLTFSARPGTIELVGPTFDLETLPSGERNWQFAGTNNSAGAFQSYFQGLPISIKDGVVRYANPATAFQTEITGLNGTLGYQEGGKYFGYSGSVGTAKDPAKLLLQLQPVDLTQASVGDTPLQMKLDYKGMSLLTKGMVSNASREFNYVGELEVHASNVWAVYAAITGRESIQTQKLDFSPEFGMKGKLTFGTRGMRLENATFDASNGNEMPVLKGALAMGYSFGKDSKVTLLPVVSNVDLDHLELAYQKWFPVIEEAKPEEEKFDPYASSVNAEDLQNKQGRLSPMLAQISGTLQLRLDNAIYHGRNIRSVGVNGVIDRGELLIEQAQGIFPGNTQVRAYGATKRAEDGLWFDGKLDMQGESLEQFMSAFAPKGVEIPPLELGKFILRTNLSYNPKQFRLADAQAAFKNSRGAGAFIVHRGDRMKIETFLRIQGLDLDVISQALKVLVTDENTSDEVKAVESNDGAATLFDVQYENKRHNWLNGLGADVQADLVLDDFVFMERKGRTAKFRLEMGRGFASLKGMDAEYNGTRITGDFGIKLESGLNPLLTANASIAEFDMVDIFPQLARTQNDEEWKKFLAERLEFMPLQSYRGGFTLGFGKLRVKNFLFEDLTTKLKLEEAKLALESFSGNLWDGHLEMAGEVQAGTIPAMAVSLSFANANLNRLAESTPLLKHAAGMIGLKAQITTSGVDFMNWFKNAQGNFAIVGNNISVQGFGLSTLARAVPLARSVQDLESAKKQALASGAILFRDLRGQGTFQNAEVNIPVINFKSEEAEGTIEGKVSMLDETVNLKTQVNLLSTYENGTAPDVFVFTNGPIEHLEKSLETQDLDAYVARKAAERTLKTVR